jgi:hypothetical protein
MRLFDLIRQSIIINNGIMSGLKSYCVHNSVTDESDDAH